MQIKFGSFLILLLSTFSLWAQQKNTGSKPPAEVQKQINSEMRKVLPLLRECFFEKENEKSKLFKVFIVFDLPKNRGKASQVHLSPKTELEDPKVNQCIINTISSIVFPDAADQKEHREVEYPLFFNSTPTKP